MILHKRNIGHFVANRLTLPAKMARFTINKISTIVQIRPLWPIGPARWTVTCKLKNSGRQKFKGRLTSPLPVYNTWTRYISVDSGERNKQNDRKENWSPRTIFSRWTRFESADSNGRLGEKRKQHRHKKMELASLTVDNWPISK